MSATILRLRHERWHQRRERAKEKRQRILAAYADFYAAFGPFEVMTGREVVERIWASLPANYEPSESDLADMEAL